MFRWILFLGLISILATPEKNTEQAVRFVSAKKVKTGIYDVTVGILDKDNKQIKGINSKCDSVITIFGYDTYIVREPKWSSYYIFVTNIKYPNMAALYPMDRRDYKRFNLPFNQTLYEETDN